MLSIFERVNKDELLMDVLDYYGARYDPHRLGWQAVRCINAVAHSRGDMNPSASVNIPAGRFNCHACLLSGDGFDLVLELEGWKAKEVVEKLGTEEGQKGGERSSDSWIL